MCVLALSTKNTTKDDIFLALQNYRGANKMDEVHARRHTTASKNRGVVFVFFFHHEQIGFFGFFAWVTNWASSIKPTNTDVFLPCSSCLCPCSSSALRLSPGQLSRSSRLSMEAVVVEYLPTDKQPKQTACAPLSLWRFYCDREQTRWIDFRNIVGVFPHLWLFNSRIRLFKHLEWFYCGGFLFIFFLFWAHSDMQRAGSIRM